MSTLSCRSFHLPQSACRLLMLVVQLCLYAGLFLLAQGLVSWCHLPIPANVVGLFLLLFLIFTRVLPIRLVQAGSRWLLAEMLLFFVPAVVAVINYPDLVIHEGWRILLVIMLSTLMVLGVTALVVDRVCRFEMRRLRRKQEKQGASC